MEHVVLVAEIEKTIDRIQNQANLLEAEVENMDILWSYGDKYGEMLDKKESIAATIETLCAIQMMLTGKSSSLDSLFA